MKTFMKVTGAVVGLLLVSFGAWAAGKYGAVGSLFTMRYMPHRFCFMLEPGLIWTNAVANGLIGLSYITIAGGLVALLRKTGKLLLFQWVFVAFGLFIVACGFTHFFEVVTIWIPVYWLSTSVTVLTAAASVATAVAFVPLVPRAAGAIRLLHEAHSRSEKQRAETLSRLLDTEERMKLAVESSGVGTWDYDAINHELHWDHRCRVLFGFRDHDPVRYEDVINRVHPEDRAQVETLLRSAVAENRHYNATFRVVTDIGETRHINARGKPFYDEARQPVRMTGTVIDLTRERQTQEALIKAEKLAVAGRMAASIAHEINNPLTAAMGHVYLARTAKDVLPQLRERLKIVEHELGRAAQITQSTLTFYRESPNPVKANPVELVESVLTFQQGRIRKAGVEVEKDLVYSEPIYAFPGELRQIITNLVSNAVEAMQDRNGKLVVRVHPAKDQRSGREGYRILVADNGPGILPEHRKKLFEAFYTTKGEQGTGLGLWITGQLVQKHGGSIKFRSRYATPGKRGRTVFSVWLPLAHDFTDPVPNPTA